MSNNNTNNYVASQIEKKWQKIWFKSGVYKVDLANSKNKFYLLVEFTYPSGDLHMGHWFAFAVPDILARFKRMNGFNVFAPSGFDAFGLPAENAAITRGVHPRDWTYANIKLMKKQFAAMGAIYDWDHEVITCDPAYFRWNQWIFLKMYERGLAYRGKALANWCPRDNCVLANENVEDGRCWRCGTEVVQKEVDQWFLQITQYADKLLWPFISEAPQGKKEKLEVGSGKKSNLSHQSKTNLDSHISHPTSNVDWPQSIRESQNNWIGRSEGAEIEFQIAGPVSSFPPASARSSQKTMINQEDNVDLRAVGGPSTTATRNLKITVFTTRPDTLYGATFVVLAPEHPLVASLLNSKPFDNSQGKHETRRN